jgi:cation:H+ antiporter
MGLFIHVMVVSVGVLFILISARTVVRSSIGIARTFGLSDTFIGMTVLSVGTSLPEIVTHLAASFRILRDPPLMDEMSALAIGTNIGSDVFQQNFLLGVVALLGAVTVSRKNLRRNVGGLIVAAVALFIFSIGGVISRLEGGMLAGGYIVYLYALERRGEEDPPDDDPDAERAVGLWRLAAETVIGFAVMALVADRVLDSAVVIVEHTFLSYSFFGVLILGIAAALPELMTALLTAMNKRASMSASILIGSNITNPAFALGIGAVVSGYTVPAVVTWYDMPVKIFTAGLLYFLLRRHSTMRNRHALVLMATYIVYLIIRQSYFPTDY